MATPVIQMYPFRQRDLIEIKTVARHNRVSTYWE
jgi:hypothetical protein